MTNVDLDQQSASWRWTSTFANYLPFSSNKLAAVAKSPHCSSRSSQSPPGRRCVREASPGSCIRQKSCWSATYYQRKAAEIKIFIVPLSAVLALSFWLKRRGKNVTVGLVAAVSVARVAADTATSGSKSVFGVLAFAVCTAGTAGARIVLFPVGSGTSPPCGATCPWNILWTPARKCTAKSQSVLGSRTPANSFPGSWFRPVGLFARSNSRCHCRT